MLVQADKLFLTASPISELVWSPRKGLGLKCADSSSAEHRTSLWWSTESFNVIATGPECNGIGGIFDNGIGTENILDPSQFVPCSSNIYDIHVSTPGSIIGVVPACCTMTQEHNSTNNASEASCEEMERLPGRNEESNGQADTEKNMTTNETKIGGSSSGKSQRNDGSTGNAAKKVSSQGGDNGNAACSAFSNSVEMDLNCDESNKGSLAKCVGNAGKRDSHDPDLVKGLDWGCNTSGKAVSYMQYADSKHSGKGVDEVNVNIHIHPRLTYFYPQVNQRLNSGDASDLSFTKSSANRGGKVAGINIREPLDNIGNETRSEPLAMKKTSGSLDNEEERRMKKGKEKIDESQEDVIVCANKESRHSSDHFKDKNDSHESVKSSNSKEFSSGKRVRCFDSEFSCKKLKQLENKTAFTGTLTRQDSSFINWFSGFAKALPCSVEAELHTALVPKMSKSMPNFSLKKGDIACNNVGFQSFVQTLHHARFKTPQMRIHDVSDQHNDPIYSHELQKSKNPSVTACGSTYHISAKLNLGQPVPLAAFRLDQYHPEELPPRAGTSSVSNFDAQVKQQCVDFNNHSLCNLGSSNSSFRIASMDPEKTEAEKPESGLHSSNVLVVSNGNEYRGSFWITRLCPRPPPPSLSGPINEVVRPATAMQLDGENLFVSNLRKENFLVEEIKCSENVHIPRDEVRPDTVRNEEHSPNRSDSSSKGGNLDKKPKAKLNPILPSKRIKKLEPITSVFAKRLDAFRHIKSPNIIDDVLWGSTCFFCGQTGHSMKDCSQVFGTNLERLQKNIKSYGGPHESACLCINCFQLTHWAVACPHSSARVNASGGFSPYIADINSEKAEEEQATEDSSLRESHHREYTKNLVVHTLGVEEVENSDTKIINDFPGEYNYKGKSILSPSVHSKEKGHQITPVYSFAKAKMFREQIRIFEDIRDLRLSHSDIVRLIKIPIPDLDLNGFFLRVRFGKYEETLEGSGYQVACISGVTQENSFGTTKHHIPVDIGGFKCLLDSRFVSNNDFMEDELNAWWSMLSRGGTKPPTEEQLARKLAERKRFGI